MRFEVKRERKRLVFDSDLRGLIVGSKQYVSGRDGELIYDQTLDLKADEVELQMSSNTSTLIPALRLLSIGYHPYFDRRDVVESQNNITFYWNRSKLAAFYNRFSTDELDFPKREPIIREAVDFLANHTSNLPLKDAFLTKVLKPCKLLGFYQGFPVFDSVEAPTSITLTPTTSSITIVWEDIVGASTYTVSTTAGTATTLAALCLKLKKYKPEKVHGYCLKKENLDGILAELAIRSVRERQQLAGIQPMRADVILAGGLILNAILKYFKKDHTLISDRGLRFGVFYKKFLK